MQLLHIEEMNRWYGFSLSSGAVKSVDPGPKAAVCYNAENNPFVYYRRGHGTLLLASPYADSLNECLV